MPGGEGGRGGIEGGRGPGMAKDGHKVTVLTASNALIEPDFIDPHNMQNQQNIYQNHPNFSYELQAIATQNSKEVNTSDKSTDLEVCVLDFGPWILD